MADDFFQMTLEIFLWVIQYTPPEGRTVSKTIRTDGTLKIFPVKDSAQKVLDSILHMKIGQAESKTKILREITENCTVNDQFLHTTDNIIFKT